MKPIKKTQDAQKAVQDYEKSSKQNKSQNDMRSAQGASNDLENAKKNQKQNKGDAAEKNLKEALEKLSGNNQQDSQKQ